MQAIETKYHGPTNSKDSRISATCQAGRIIISCKDELNLEQNHIAAAVQLCVKLGWSYDFVSGTLKNENFVHVFTEEPSLANWGARNFKYRMYQDHKQGN